RPVSHLPAEPRHELLLQRRPVRGRDRPGYVGDSHEQSVRRPAIPRAAALALRGREHVRDLPAGAVRAPLRARDQGPTVARRGDGVRALTRGYFNLATSPANSRYFSSSLAALASPVWITTQ